MGETEGPIIRYMKKTYVSPLAMEVSVEAEPILEGSLRLDGKNEIDTSKDGAQLAGGQRGSWGNLWE